jgi:hypothetical protein
MKQLDQPTGNLPKPAQLGKFGGTLREIYFWVESVKRGRIRLDWGNVKLIHLYVSNNIGCASDILKKYRDMIPDADPRRAEFDFAYTALVEAHLKISAVETDHAAALQRATSLESKVLDMKMELDELRKKNDELIGML